MCGFNLVKKLSGILIFLTLYTQGNGDKQCAEFNQKCDPRHQEPCCNKAFSCQLKGLINDFVCEKKTLLDSPCIWDEDCRSIRHAKCSTEKKCVCRSNNLKINETYCAPLLGAYCWKYETCATENAVCSDNECRCIEHHHRSGDHCLPVITGINCRDNEDCAKIKYAECSENTCVCTSNTIAVNNTSCVPLLGARCDVDRDCKVSNSMCVNERCRCQYQYVSMDQYNCVLPYLGMRCIDSSHCLQFIAYTVCSSSKLCECSPNSYQSNNTCIASLNKKCSSQDDCDEGNSMCIDGNCQCRPGYVLVGFICTPGQSINNSRSNGADFSSMLGEICSIDDDCLAFKSVCNNGKCECEANYSNSSIFECLPILVGLACRVDSNCIRIPNSNCSDNKCTCKPNYRIDSDGNCSPTLGSSCTEKCAPENSICFNGKCECIEYNYRRTDQCFPKILEKSCLSDDDCRAIEFSTCSKYKFCTCQKNYVSVNGTACHALLGEHCSPSLPCGAKNSLCIGNKCHCKPLFKENDKYQCLSHHLGEYCENDDDCMMIKYSICSKNRICACNYNYTVINPTTCAPIINGECVKDDDCYVRNSVCTAKKCQCRTDFVSDHDFACIRHILGIACNSSNDCSILPNSFCSEDKICACKLNYFASDNYCLPTVNAHCSGDEECMDGLMNCVDNKCQCNSNYSAVSAEECRETQSLYTCERSLDCSDPWHWRCSESGRCICKNNNISVNNTSCLPILHGPCWRDDQCMVKNSICIDFHCHCQHDFVAIARNSCVSKKL